MKKLELVPKFDAKFDMAPPNWCIILFGISFDANQNLASPKTDPKLELAPKLMPHVS